MKSSEFEKKTDLIFGTGMLKGMWVTLKNMIDSYYKKPEDGGIFTTQYPEEKCRDFDTARNFPFLVYDETPEKPRCVACGICERDCPVKCIHVVMAKDAAGKPLRKPAAFDVDYTICMNCGNCEEVCPFDSIFMDHDYDIASYDRKSLLKPMNELLKSNAYFHKIRPTDAAAVDAGIKAALEKKKAPPPAAPQQPPASQGPQ